MRAPRSIVIVDFFEDADGNHCERCRLFTARDNGQPRTCEREDERRHARAGNGDVRADAARGRFAAELLADGPRRTDQPRQPADVDRHEIVAVSFVARRELLGDRMEGEPFRLATRRP